MRHRFIAAQLHNDERCDDERRRDHQHHTM
jgi:hypothetical protein